MTDRGKNFLPVNKDIYHDLCTICMKLRHNVCQTILKHKIIVNLKFDIVICCCFGLLKIGVIVFAQNCIIIIVEINEIAML